MPDVRPFRGLRYNPEKVESLSDVITPPYDIISATAQDSYYRKSDRNIIRIEYGKEQTDDSASNNKYTRASAYLKDWIEKGVLVPEDEPSYYIYAQEFSHDGHRFRRTGLIAAVKLEEWSVGEILPHEETHAKAKVDRLNLMKACAANISPVFGLYENHSDAMIQDIEDITKRNPEVDFVDEFGERHILWVVSEPTILDTIHDALKSTKIFIADGHHRYETALKYRDDLRQLCPNCTEDEAFNFVMMILVEVTDAGLLVLPTHRLVRNLSNFDSNDLRLHLRESFDIDTVSCERGQAKERLASFMTMMESRSRHAHTFGVFEPKQCEFWLLTLRPEARNLSGTRSVSSDALLNLDVSILHNLILEAGLGLDSQSLADESHVSYTRDDAEAVDEALKGNCQLVLFLNPTKVQDVQAVALARERMPQKSTYFHPKLPTGLVINSLEGTIPFGEGDPR